MLVTKSTGQKYHTATKHSYLSVQIDPNYVDASTQLGAIEASAYLHDRDIQIIFDFDKIALNEDLGFENKEFITACVVAGEIGEKSVRKLRDKIPFVCATDYFEKNSFVEAGYQNTILPESEKQKLLLPQFQFDKERYLEAVLNRRSARYFERSRSISQANFLQILQVLAQPIPTEIVEDIELYFAIKRVEGIESGLYRSDRINVISRIKAGDFSEKTGYLCINQAIAKNSAVTLFLVSDYRNYQTATQLVSLLGQRLYLVSEYLGLSCSGIGAYHDDETQEFLETDKDVLYAMAIG